MAQVTRGMAALANGLGSGHTAASESASSVGSILDMFRHHQCQHLDTWPRVNQVVRVAVEVQIISVQGRQDSCHACGQVGQQADGISRQECNVPSRHLEHPGASSRQPPVQTSEAMKPAGQDRQIGRVHS